MNSCLLSLLICPRSGASLEYDRDKGVLVCHESGLEYPIVEGIPVLIEEEASQVK